MAFVRRFTQVPSTDVLMAIEGINIIDLPPPGSNQGVNTNVAALVGEFADMTFATQVDASGNITTFGQPVQIVTGQDLLNKVGGFDKTIGAFGAGCGNGFVELRNKKFSALVVCPVNMASGSGIRLWRLLPTNQSATNPVAVIPVSAATVAAGTLFLDASKILERMKLGKAVFFSALPAYLTGVDGNVTHAAAAATNTFQSAGGGFSNVLRPDGKIGVQVGDILVVGTVGGSAGANLDDAGQFRVTSLVNDTEVLVQAMNGANFAFLTSSTALAWRLHPASTADSFGDGALSPLTNQGSYNVPVWPITNDAGTGSGATDGTWATGTALAPVLAPPALTAVTADPLSGLAALVGPTTAVAYTAAVQRPNAPNNAAIDVLYLAAINAFLADDVPESTVSHIWAARKSQNIRIALNQFVASRSGVGVGVTASISPEMGQPTSTALATVTGNANPGVGAIRAERLFYDWPHLITFIPEAVGTPITGADGSIVLDGTIDITADGWMASILSNLAPERNPGESTQTTQAVLAPLIGYGRNVPQLDINAWILMRQVGIAGVRFDRNTGPEFQSGITTSLTAGQKNINRRKFADYAEDNFGVALKPFCKLPLSNEVIDAAAMQCVDLCDLWLSPDNSSLQRIQGYDVDKVSGNTPTLLGDGIFVIVVTIQTLATADFIVVQCQVAPTGVTVTTSVPSAALPTS